MGWPDNNNVDAYCDYNNGLYEFKRTMVQDYCNSQEIRDKFPSLEDYAHYLNDVFDQNFWGYTKTVTITTTIHPPSVMTEEEKEIINQIL